MTSIYVQTTPSQDIEGVHFENKNPEVVNVSAFGFLQPVGLGTAEVIVRYGNLSETCYIYVTGGFYEGP